MAEAGSYIIEGTVAEGYESLKRMFKANYELGCEENSQLCIYVGEQKVVDLWGRVEKDSKFDADSLINVFSSTKSITAIMMAMAKDRGWLDYSDKISRHWPEFAQEGKGDITIADLMKHEAGFATLTFPLELEDLTTENIKKNVVGDKIARMPARYPKGRKREYHALTRGWLANEIFRRVHPENLTLGEFLQQEIASQLKADLYIGCIKENFFVGRHAELGYTFKESFKCALGFQNGVNESVISLMKLMYGVAKAGKAPPVISNMKDALDIMNDDFRRTETPSANGNCSARGLALLGCLMANKGQYKGTRLISESTWEAMHGNATEDILFFDHSVPMTQGGIAKYPKDNTFRDGYYGWAGYGGSVFQWHPEVKIGFAYTCTLLFPMTLRNEKVGEYQAEVVRCARTLNK